MSERKPLNIEWRTWVDELVARAEKEGAFENLKGAGKPLEGLEAPYDENWWLKAWLAREDLGITPEPLDLRRKIELLREEIPRLRDERAARGAFLALNAMIGRLNALPAPDVLGPIAPVDVESEVRGWRRARGRGENSSNSGADGSLGGA